MKSGILFVLLIISTTIVSQTNTEVFLFDLIKKGDAIIPYNQRNVSNNDGYDNQPSFFNNTTILFSGTRNNQTDIAVYNITDAKVKWLTNTKGSEYSPTKIPGQEAVSAIRLDPDGKQLLYSYNYKTGQSKVLIYKLVIGYHTWHTKDIIISSVLQDSTLSLVVSNLKDHANYTVQKNIGRSLHKIPNSNLISYISKENKEWQIKSLDPTSGATKKMINTIPKAEDMCWLADGTILMGEGNQIFKFNPKTDSDWSIFYSFKNTDISNITRMATNIAGTMLTLVSDVSK